jgi:phospholipase/carboxylesterase
MSHLRQESDDAVVLNPPGEPDACVIWLHGLGADGHDFLPLVPELRLPASAAPRFVFPHAPVRAVTINNGMRMRAWYDIRELAAGGLEDEAGIRDSAARLTARIRAERDAGIPADRILLAGFSQGGAIALHTALRHPEPLAGLLALSTYLPLAGTLPKEAANSHLHLPILMCHGRYDPILPLGVAERSREALRAQGHVVEWREYPMQHEVSAREVVDIAAWLKGVLYPRLP